VPLVRDAVRRVDVGARVIDIDVAFLGDTVPEGLAAGSTEASGAVERGPSGAAASGPSAGVAGDRSAGGPDGPSAAAICGAEGR
jgi:hypothetical protein